MHKYEYYIKPDAKLESLDKAEHLIKKYKLKVNSSYHEMIEHAELNDATACLELFCFFRYGKAGFPVNYDLTRYYADKLIDIANDRGEPILKYDIHKNAGYMEAGFGNYEKAIEELTTASKIMVDNLPVEKWDEEVFIYLKEYIRTVNS